MTQTTQKEFHDLGAQRLCASLFKTTVKMSNCHEHVAVGDWEQVLISRATDSSYF